jgi:glucokinase
LGGRRIIGDIGGTNARFAIAEGGKYRELMHVEVGRFGSLRDALTDYLNGLPPALRSGLDGALAVAGPVFGDKVTLTNLGWSFSISDLHRSLGLGSLKVVNDFAATAMAVPRLPGGIYVAGGILLRFKEAFASSPFREKFERKGRFAGMLAKIPTCLILEESPALLGLAHLPLVG